MKVIREIVSLLIVIMVVAGCSKSDTPSSSDQSTSDGYEASTTPITFETLYNWGDDDTKGFATTTNNFKEFGVLAYYIKDGESIDDVTPNFMYDQQVSLSSDEWSYSPVKYWPNNSGDKVQFFGYHPYNSDEIVLSDNSAVGYPTFDVTPNLKPYNQDDFIVASTDPMSSEDGNVSLYFTHKQAQARLYAAHQGDKSSTMKILSVTISGFRASGKLVYDDTIEGSDKFVWEHQQTDESEPVDEDKAIYYFDNSELDLTQTIPYLEEATATLTDYTALGYGEGQSYMMLIPQDVIGELTFVVLFSYEYDGSTIQSFQELSLSGSTLKENEIKNYLLHIDPGGVGFGTINVTSEAWVDVEINNGEEDSFTLE